MHPFLKNLKTQAEENPMFALGLGTAIMTAVTAAANTLVNAKNSRAWSKEVARRTMRDGVRKSR